MKTLILNGSPRANGDTVSLIKELTKKLPGEYKIVDAYQCDVSPCVDCRYCWEHSGCAIADEMHAFQTAAFVKLRFQNGPHRIRILFRFHRKGGKIMFAFQKLERGTNRIQILKIVKIPAPAVRERIDSAAVDDIDIGFSQGGKTSIEGFRDFRNIPHPDIRRQDPVQRFQNLPFRNIAVGRG